MSEEPVWHKYGFTKSIAMGVERSYDMARQILVSLTSASTYKERQLGGPILIAQAAGGSAEKGINYYLWFMAILSINLGVLNLLPLPVLGAILLWTDTAWAVASPQAKASTWTRSPSPTP